MTLNNLLKTLEIIKEPITVSQMKCFLNVALNEGISIVKLSEKMGYNQASATRDMETHTRGDRR